MKSQWDFGELFPPEQIQKTLTVAELTFQIKKLLERQVGEVRVTGEVTNLKGQSSGHIYFSLKDALAQLSCVLFRGEAQVDRSLLEDGRKVILKGQVTVYEARGAYQLRVTGVELQGIGPLQAAFERLKAKLNQEGLFSKERKRPLPRFAKRIGLVTSPTGAAIRDVIHVLERRNPTLEIILAPCRVQGAGSAAEIASAIALLNQFNLERSAPGGRSCLDAILITRGGGSLEDLWPFNEEIVARAIYNSVLPTVSAVGHEIDFSISDFVADFRAATPSAAAEILTEDVFRGCQVLEERYERLGQLVAQQMGRSTAAFTRALEGLLRVHPSVAVEERAQRLDDAIADLGRCAGSGVRRQSLAFREFLNRLARLRPMILISRRHEAVRMRGDRLKELARRQLRDRNQRLEFIASRLALLGPDQVLARGYSITTDENGAIIRDAKTIRAGRLISTKLKAGRLVSRVEDSGEV